MPSENPKRVRCCRCGKELVISKNDPGIHTCCDLQEMQRQEINKLRKNIQAVVDEAVEPIKKEIQGLKNIEKARWKGWAKDLKESEVKQ
jgi:hypothetical protein